MINGLITEPEGLLPWGGTENGDTLFWLTEGEADNWSVLINESHSPEFERYNEDMTSFLAKLITGRIKSKIITNKVLDKKHLFTPIE